MINEMIKEEERQIESMSEMKKEFDDMPHIIMFQREIGILKSNLSKLKAIKAKIEEIHNKYRPKVYQDGKYTHYYDYIQDLKELLGVEND